MDRTPEDVFTGSRQQRKNIVAGSGMLFLREERAALVVLRYFTVHESQQYSGKETLALIGCYMYHVLFVGTLQGLGCATSFGIRSADGQTQCFPLRLAVPGRMVLPPSEDLVSAFRWRRHSLLRKCLLESRPLRVLVPLHTPTT